MNEPHDSGHEQLLASVLSGEVDRAAGAVQTRLAACAVCRDELRRLEGTARTLDEMGVLERAVLAQLLADEAPAPGEPRVRALVASRAAPPLRLFERRWSRARLLAAGAAALVLAGLGVWLAFGGARGGGGDVPKDVYLGASHPAALTPHGEVASFARFGWDLALPPGGRYRVAVWRASDADRAEPLLDSGDLTAPQWSPGPRDVATLPAEIYWEVQVRDAFQQTLSVAGTRAWLSPR